MGRTVTLYHGGPKPIRRFDPTKSATGNFWFAEDPDSIIRGEHSAEVGQGAYITKVRLHVSKVAGWDEYERYFTEQLIDMGYDSAKLDDVWIAFDPDRIEVVSSAKVRLHNPGTPKLSAAQTAQLIKSSLRPDDLKAPYNRPPRGAHRLWGHCAVASEALFYATGGRGPASQYGEKAGGPNGWHVWRVPHEGSTHWFLTDKNGKIWDLTREQFRAPVPYHLAKKTFFVTSRKGQGPSKRVQEVLRRVSEARRRAR